jgi:hypothetical protein
MGDYRTIKALVIEACMQEGQLPSYEVLTALVKEHFPNSRWKKSHYAWYKSMIKTGEIVVPGLNDPAHESEEEDIDAEASEAIEATVSLERDLHMYFASRVSEIERGLKIEHDGIEHTTDAGRIDILARDERQTLVVIELKAGRAKDEALGQLLGYMGCLSKNPGDVRGILVASNFEPRVVFAARGLPTVKLLRYELSFTMKEIT